MINRTLRRLQQAIRDTFMGTVTVGFSVFVIASPAQATLSVSLLELDLVSAGDNLLTFDTSTNLEWLDVDLTTNLSYNDVVGGASVSGVGILIDLGFRHANVTEVANLYAAFGITDVTGTVLTGAGDIAAITDLIQAMGCTGSCGGTDPNRFSRGFAEFVPDTGFVDQPFAETFTLSGDLVGQANFGFSVAKSFSTGSVGNYLVRQVFDTDQDGVTDNLDPCPNNPDLQCVSENSNDPSVPEPGALALFIIGLIGIGVAVRRQRKAA